MNSSKVFKVSVEQVGEGKYHFLRGRYGKNYMGQILLKNPRSQIPKIIRVLKKELKEFNGLYQVEKKAKEEELKREAKQKALYKKLRKGKKKRRRK